MRYSIQPGDRIFAKSYLFSSFTRNICKNVGKNISKNLNRKYVTNVLIMLKNLQQIHLKLLQNQSFNK